MAETVYLPDGTMEVILTDKDVFLERLLEEKLGRDVANCFRGYVQELQDELKWVSESNDEQEKIADGYLQMCNNALEVFRQLDALIRSPHPNHSALQKLITEGYKELHHNL